MEEKAETTRHLETYKEISKQAKKITQGRSDVKGS